jgi:mono/diheme cytochrome c family protein
MGAHRARTVAGLVLGTSLAGVACAGRPTDGQADGPTVFAKVCATCHGAAGRPTAAMVAQLGVRDLTAPEFRARARVEAVAIQVRTGSANKLMPGFAGTLSEREIDGVARFVVTRLAGATVVTTAGGSDAAAGPGSGAGPAVVDAAPVVAEGVDASAAELEDGFRQLARDLATDSRWAVTAWGQAGLGADAAPVRFAVLMTRDERVIHGGYLLEQDPTHRWLLIFDLEGETLPWLGRRRGGGAEPAWIETGDEAITHREDVGTTSETLRLAVRGDRVVVLERVVRVSRQPVQRESFVGDDGCTRCPDLRAFEPRAAIFDVVVGPVADPAALREWPRLR